MTLKTYRLGDRIQGNSRRDTVEVSPLNNVMLNWGCNLIYCTVFTNGHRVFKVVRENSSS